MLPNFLIIGSQKAGTTSLYHVLKQHPEIYMSETKEINFFFHDKLFNRGIQFYERFFDNTPLDKTVCGEASPGYICHPEAPARVKKYLPSAKLILTVRNPINRAYSQYWDNRRSLSESKTFEEAIDLYLTDSYEPGRVGYFSRGVYMKYIERFLQHFNCDQLLVLVFEDLIENAVLFYRKIFQFLNVNSEIAPKDVSRVHNPFSVYRNPFYRFFFFKPHYQRYLPGRLKSLLFWGNKEKRIYPTINSRAKSRLTEFYEPWNKKLSGYLERDLSVWKQ